MIGRQPIRTELTLTPGQDFTHAVEPPSGYVFQPATTLRIDIVDSRQRDAAVVASWPATVTADRAGWLVQSEVTDLIPSEDRLWFRLYISYPDSPTSDHAWFSGPVLYSP